MSSRLLKAHQPCPCGKSSDAYSEYENGGHCFSCGKHFGDYNMEDTGTYTFEYLPWRGITKETMERYKVLTKINDEGKPVSVGFPYGNSAYKIRDIALKRFISKGPISSEPLFGMAAFSAGSFREITITEGEMDAMSMFQVTGRPAVSIRGASSAKRDISANIEYFNAFNRIYLALDNDGPGEEATKAIASLFDFNKVYHVKLTKYKDANDYVQNDASDELKWSWVNAKRFLPAEVFSSFSQFRDLLREEAAESLGSYPFPTMQSKTYGLRAGEVVLFTALEGIGKTEIIRAIEYHILKSTDHKIAVIHLEESKKRTLQGLASYELDRPVHLPDSSLSEEEVFAAIQKAVVVDDRLHIYTHFGSDDPDVILSIIRFLVSSCGCKVVFLDHITMLVTGSKDDDERRSLDYLSTKFEWMVEELGFCLVLVSHVNDDGKTRGSRNISKIADLWVELIRDKEAATEVERNTTTLMCKKNRFASHTGIFGFLYFDPSTFKVTEMSEGMKEAAPGLEGLPT